MHPSTRLRSALKRRSGTALSNKNENHRENHECKTNNSGQQSLGLSSDPTSLCGSLVQPGWRSGLGSVHKAAPLTPPATRPPTARRWSFWPAAMSHRSCPASTRLTYPLPPHRGTPMSHLINRTGAPNKAAASKALIVRRARLIKWDMGVPR